MREKEGHSGMEARDETIKGLIQKPKRFFNIQFDTTVLLQRWLIATLIAFISLAIILIAFQNPNLDIQTLFVGRVQFIQSHAVYALWLGYGLILALNYLEALFRNRSVKYQRLGIRNR